MRHLVLALTLSLAACSSTTGSCSTAPPGSACDSFPDDVIPFDSSSDGARDVGPEFVTLQDASPEAAPRDAVSHEDVTADTTAIDAVPDVVADVSDAPDATADARVDAGEASAPSDVAAVDVPPGECAAVERACRINADCAMCTPVRGLTWCCGGIGGRAACVVPDSDGTCPGVVTDAGPAAPDARVSCSAVFMRCSTDAQCQAMCVPLTSGYDWCCSRLNGVCGTTESGSCMR